MGGPFVHNYDVLCKKFRRRLEQRWRSSRKLEIDRQLFTSQRDVVWKIIKEAKAVYFENQISSCENPRELYKVINTLLHQRLKPKLPVHDSDHELAVKFSGYFDAKIIKIRSELDCPAVSTVPVRDICSGDIHALHTFDPATEDEVLQVIASSSSTSSSNDPFPTWMLKIHVKCLLPRITKIVNESLRYGVFPDCFKSVIVCPLLKKPNLDIEDLKNYRPVSNLKFLSKVLERIVAVRLHDHLESHIIYPSRSSQPIKSIMEQRLLYLKCTMTSGC